MCICPEDNKVLYVLGDMDLLCHDGEQVNTNCDVWEKMALHDPAGTIDMRPPEVKRLLLIYFLHVLAVLITCISVSALCHVTHPTPLYNGSAPGLHLAPSLYF